MLGMVSGQISDSQISVWPSAERGWLPEQARLLTGRTGWVVAHPQGPVKNQSLEIDLGAQRMVTGLILQGGKYRDVNIFIKRFRVTYSMTGTDWSHIQEEKSNRMKVLLYHPWGERPFRARKKCLSFSSFILLDGHKIKKCIIFTHPGVYGKSEPWHTRSSYFWSSADAFPACVPWAWLSWRHRVKAGGFRVWPARWVTPNQPVTDIKKIFKWCIIHLPKINCFSEPTTPLPLTTTMETTVATITSAPGYIPTSTIIPSTAESCDDDGNCHSEAVTDYDTTG